MLAPLRMVNEMRSGDIVRLLILAAIWGGSFIFMRILAPVLGPVVTADLRVLIAGIALILYFHVIRFDPQWRRWWKQYLLIGAINSALPFCLFSFAAIHIPASLSAILNSMSPLFGAIFSAIWLSERLSVRRIVGLLIGAVGVMLVVKVGVLKTDPLFGWAVAACVVAALCYGVAATYIKRFAVGVKPMGIAGASQLMAGILLIPAVPLSLPTGVITFSVMAGMLAFALLCSAIAYLLYYRLIADVGPTKALTVTFLMPVFGMIWGMIILKETITFPMLAGTALIILGTGLVLTVGRPGRG
ncbi:MAG: DMT family transporter [candidate division Zixibacteria bacterium]|nr:DMT family transporter [candidate division Zixibacteria bacterium]